MSRAIEYQAFLIGLSLMTGIWLMMAYDTLRLLRLMIRHHPLAVGLEDLCYWIGAGAVTLRLLYEHNDGIQRAYIIGGVLGGMIFYDRTVSRFLFGVLKKAGKRFTIIKSIKKRKEKSGE